MFFGPNVRTRTYPKIIQIKTFHQKESITVYYFIYDCIGYILLCMYHTNMQTVYSILLCKYIYIYVYIMEVYIRRNYLCTPAPPPSIHRSAVGQQPAPGTGPYLANLHVVLPVQCLCTLPGLMKCEDLQLCKVLNQCHCKLKPYKR